MSRSSGMICVGPRRIRLLWCFWGIRVIWRGGLARGRFWSGVSSIKLSIWIHRLRIMLMFRKVLWLWRSWFISISLDRYLRGLRLSLWVRGMGRIRGRRDVVSDYDDVFDLWWYVLVFITHWIYFSCDRIYLLCWDVSFLVSFFLQWRYISFNKLMLGWHW